MLPHNTSPITHNVQLPVSSPAAHHISCPSSPKIFFRHTVPSTAIVPLFIHHQDPLLLTQTSNQQTHLSSLPSSFTATQLHPQSFIGLTALTSSQLSKTTILPTSTQCGIISFDPIPLAARELEEHMQRSLFCENLTIHVRDFLRIIDQICWACAFFFSR